jgi:hypothetical protein
MAVGITTQHPFNEKSYITVAEYLNAPTAIDSNNLVVGGNASAQNVELANVIMRASSFMDEYLNQNLNATSQVENQRTRFTPEGFIALHPNNNPVISLSSFQYGSTPNSLQSLSDCSQVWFEDQQIIIPVSQMATTYSSQGPLAFGGAGSTSNQIFVRYTYVAGYVNNLIATATAGQTSLTVQDASGIVAGMTLTINDGVNTESVTVGSTYAYGSTTVPVASALLYSHANTVTIGNMPNTIKQSCILVTTAFLKARGDASMTMALSVNPSRNVTPNALYGSEIALALQMLDLYKRVR